jgi:putative transposase
MKRLRQLEEENGKLKKIVADQSLEMLQDVIRRKYLHWQPRPCRHAAGRRLRFCCEQVDLLWRTAARRLHLTWHGTLPDSGRGRESIRPKAGHSMM